MDSMTSKFIQKLNRLRDYFSRKSELLTGVIYHKTTRLIFSSNWVTKYYFDLIFTFIDQKERKKKKQLIENINQHQYKGEVVFDSLLSL
jgi:hypothetical protein